MKNNSVPPLLNKPEKAASGDLSKEASFFQPTFIPLVLTMAGLFTLVMCRTWHTRWLAWCGFAIFILGLFYFVIQMLARLARRHWRLAFHSLAALLFCIAALVPASIFAFALEIAGPSEDGFADNLKIPEGVAAREPLPEQRTIAQAASLDLFQKTILEALAKPAVGDSTIVPSLPSLRILSTQKRDLLIRHLAASPAWRLCSMNGKLCAVRRWNINGHWDGNVNGYYSASEVQDVPSPESSFQSRVLIAFEELRTRPGTTRLPEGTNAVAVSVTKLNYDASTCLIDCGGVSVEIFDESEGQERRVTKAALVHLEKEFAAILMADSWDKLIQDQGGLSQGKPAIELRNGMQPGIYKIEGRVNPAEQGTVYLRAYEVTNNTRLSESRLFESSNERVGWSEKSTQLFLYSTEVTIYEGDWGKPYAARFELWFRPENGGPERKLVEAVFKIEGWQR